ncbi:hypothetical protein OHC33_001471 [Knufia fluminis]|uniref:Uncharacterized protein n=1 Tax=Knufia fluminis TaxID=191047 RepID=A0AAN8ERM2_9EURO|nr:hypothetical protein OHC33_001471 [Knufia fluminis]
MEDAHQGTDQPFRLLDLPPELQVRVYEKYFEGAELKIVAYDKQGHFKFEGMPALDLERTCWTVNIEARKARSHCTSRKMDVFEPYFIQDNLDAFSGGPRYDWIRQHIDKIYIGGASFPIDEINPSPTQSDWSALIQSCPRPEKVSITFFGYQTRMNVPAVGAASNAQSGSQQALTAMMVDMLKPTVDVIDQSAIQGLRLRDLARAQVAAGRGKDVCIMFPSRWVDQNGGILFNMQACIAVGSDETIVECKFCDGPTLKGLWMIGFDMPYIEEVTQSEAATDAVEKEVMQGSGEAGAESDIDVSEYNGAQEPGDSEGEA